MHDGAGRQEVLRRNFSAGQTQIVTLLADQFDHGTQVLGRRTALLGIGDDQARQAGDFVHGAVHGDAFDEIAELHAAVHFGDHRVSVRIPVGHDSGRG